MLLLLLLRQFFSFIFVFSCLGATIQHQQHTAAASARRHSAARESFYFIYFRWSFTRPSCWQLVLATSDLNFIQKRSLMWSKTFVSLGTFHCVSCATETRETTMDTTMCPEVEELLWTMNEEMVSTVRQMPTHRNWVSPSTRQCGSRETGCRTVAGWMGEYSYIHVTLPQLITPIDNGRRLYEFAYEWRSRVQAIDWTKRTRNDCKWLNRWFCATKLKTGRSTGQFRRK